MPSVEAFDHVLLSFPSLIHLAAQTGDAPRSWIQLARTGSFVSNRYGKFSITREDLVQMLHNFNNITPKAPTELPIDFDHLSMEAQKPGDGIAAGWFKKLELRETGEELWGEVEWTPDAAEKIQNREYRFVSPSFVKNHVHKDGKKIGTTLLAAAITNHPFLEGMKALTLYNFSALGDLAVAASTTAIKSERAIHLADIGQHVTFKDDAAVIPELSAEERAQTYSVKAIVGDGDDQFVRLTTIDGTNQVGWFRVDQLQPADAPQRQENNPLPEATTEEVQMSEDATITAAAQFLARVIELGGDKAAIDRATDENRLGAKAYRLAGLSMTDEPTEEPVISLSAKPGESFDQLATRYAAEKNVPLRQAVHEVGRLRPDLAEAR